MIVVARSNLASELLFIRPEIGHETAWNGSTIDSSIFSVMYAVSEIGIVEVVTGLARLPASRPIGKEPACVSRAWGCYNVIWRLSRCNIFRFIHETIARRRQVIVALCWQIFRINILVRVMKNDDTSKARLNFLLNCVVAVVRFEKNDCSRLLNTIRLCMRHPMEKES